MGPAGDTYGGDTFHNFYVAHCPNISSIDFQLTRELYLDNGRFIVQCYEPLQSCIKNALTKGGE